MDVEQFARHVVEPVLQCVPEYYSRAAVQLILGTAAVESRFHYVAQLGRGPALGLYQCEPHTHDDIWDNYLIYNPQYRIPILQYVTTDIPKQEQLVWNLAYATLVARTHYKRVSAKLPEYNDVVGQAAYWKQYYNTHLGAGTAHKYIEAYHRLVAPAWR